MYVSCPFGLMDISFMFFSAIRFSASKVICPFPTMVMSFIASAFIESIISFFSCITSVTHNFNNY